jgi:hypothetical protein
MPRPVTKEMTTFLSNVGLLAIATTIAFIAKWLIVQSHYASLNRTSNERVLQPKLTATDADI